MGKLLADSAFELMALNTSEPANGNELSPFEALHGLLSPVSGIPMTPKVKRMLTDRKKLAYSNTVIFDDGQTLNNRSNPKCPDIKKCLGEDGDAQTRLERKYDKNWLEKIHQEPTEGLSSGDKVYFKNHIVKGWGRWRPGVILARKTDYVYADGIRPANGFDIYDPETRRPVTRTRMDIRKYKMTRVEKDLMEKAVEHCNKMKWENENSKTFMETRQPVQPDFRVVDWEKDAKRPPRPFNTTPASSPTPPASTQDQLEPTHVQDNESSVEVPNPPTIEELPQDWVEMGPNLDKYGQPIGPLIRIRLKRIPTRKVGNSDFRLLPSNSNLDSAE